MQPPEKATEAVESDDELKSDRASSNRRSIRECGGCEREVERRMRKEEEREQPSVVMAQSFGGNLFPFFHLLNSLFFFFSISQK